MNFLFPETDCFAFLSELYVSGQLSGSNLHFLATKQSVAALIV